MLQWFSIAFPVLAIKFFNTNLCKVFWIDTTNVNIKSIWIGTWNVKWGNTALLAKVVLCNFCIKFIAGQVLLGFIANFEFACWHNIVQVSLHAAYCAIAIQNVNLFGSKKFTLHQFAMACCWYPWFHCNTTSHIKIIARCPLCFKHVSPKKFRGVLRDDHPLWKKNLVTPVGKMQNTNEYHLYAQNLWLTSVCLFSFPNASSQPAVCWRVFCCKKQHTQMNKSAIFVLLVLACLAVAEVYFYEPFDSMCVFFTRSCCIRWLG